MVRRSVSTGCLPRLEGKQFFGLMSVVRMMKRFVADVEMQASKIELRDSVCMIVFLKSFLIQQFD